MSSPQIAFPSILSTRCVDEFEESCLICLDKSVDVIGTCGHPICWICAKRWIMSGNKKCPYARCDNFLPLLGLQPSFKNSQSYGKIDISPIKFRDGKFYAKTETKLNLNPFVSENFDFNHISESFKITKNVYIVHHIVAVVFESSGMCTNKIYFIDNYGNIYKVIFYLFTQETILQQSTEIRLINQFSDKTSQTYHNIFDNVLSNHQINSIKKIEFFTSQISSSDEIIIQKLHQICNTKNTTLAIQQSISVDSLLIKIKDMEHEHNTIILECMKSIDEMKLQHSLQIQKINDEHKKLLTENARLVKQLTQKTSLHIVNCTGKILEYQQLKYSSLFD
jgi:hypothetical protein